MTQLRYGLLSVLLWGLVLCSGFARAEETVTVFFFNPEINTARNSILKSEYDQLLGNAGPFRFQPVRDQSVFENLVRTEPKAIFMMSDWHFKKLSKTAPIFSYLIGERNGSTTYKKILVRRSTRERDASFKLSTIASAGNTSYSQNLLREILANRPELTGAMAKILVVPKDLDALLAVGFGMADAAICTEESFQQLSSLYGNQYEQLSVWGESQERNRMTLVAYEHLSEQQVELLRFLHSLGFSEAGQRHLRMLGLDRWQPVAESRLHFNRNDSSYKTAVRIAGRGEP